MKLVSLAGFALQSHQIRKVGGGSHYPFVNCAGWSLFIHLWPYRFQEEFTVSQWHGEIGLTWRVMESIHLFKSFVSSHSFAFFLITSFFPSSPRLSCRRFTADPCHFLKEALHRFYISSSLYSAWGLLLSLCIMSPVALDLLQKASVTNWSLLGREGQMKDAMKSHYGKCSIYCFWNIETHSREWKSVYLSLCCNYLYKSATLTHLNTPLKTVLISPSSAAL